ncbi:DUF1217 domain-containing protein [Ancylobacter dichloromethanicus]|uniref:Flagellar basal body rod protein FlgF n=1 Tax=Ancylobacter dichloromethanicus TaxID=518825 RepID=A0A9W6MXI7_9HYPH|nr:DUF1217 domain-containing protein [Ancylobacter dichloromethanicus]MBS7556313.1 DUF1217 domain-containing protein [Ancylobacter dichloromethanicus]GLK70076.1 flagellar basal body rod protein FlgF [Ancylobacter dichloromethanicus]
MDTTFATFQLLTRNLPRSLSLKAAEPTVALETKHFLATVPGIKSVDAFLKNTRVFTYAMNAFGLGDMAHAKGYMRKVLTEGITDKTAFANRLNDERFVAFAKAFDFDNYGALTTTRPAARQEVADKYVRQMLEIDEGAQNEGVRLALYFQREAPNVKSAYGLLADPALWRVVKTIYGFPDAMAAADIEKQAKAITQRLDVAALKEPAQLNRLLQRFTARWDADQGLVSSPVLALFGKSPGVGSDVGMALLSLKYGG